MTLTRLRTLVPMIVALAFAAGMFTIAAPHSLGAPWMCGLLAVLALFTAEQTQWTVDAAAEQLGVSYKTLLNKIKECGISRK